MQNRSRREIDVERIPQIAHPKRENPSAAGNLDGSVESHHRQRDEYIGQGQRHDEIVSNDAKLPVAHDTDHDQQVTQNGDQYDASHNGSLKCCDGGVFPAVVLRLVIVPDAGSVLLHTTTRWLLTRPSSYFLACSASSLSPTVLLYPTFCLSISSLPIR